MIVLGSPPHTRGKVSCSNALTEITGSPPHTRGKAVVKVVKAAGIGITPAYTGKRVTKINIEMLVKDHPRIHGEKESQNELSNEI